MWGTLHEGKVQQPVETRKTSGNTPPTYAECILLRIGSVARAAEINLSTRTHFCLIQMCIMRLGGSKEFLLQVRNSLITALNGNCLHLGIFQLQRVQELI